MPGLDERGPAVAASASDEAGLDTSADAADPPLEASPPGGRDEPAQPGDPAGAVDETGKAGADPPAAADMPQSTPDGAAAAGAAAAAGGGDPSPAPPPSPQAAGPKGGPGQDDLSSPAFPAPRGVRAAGAGPGTVAATAAAAAAVAFIAGLVAADMGLLGQDPADGAVSNEDLAAMIGDLHRDLLADRAASVAGGGDAGPSPSDVDLLVDDDPAKGDPDAPLVMIEFSDFQCPFCGRFYEQTLPLIERDYIDTGKVRLVYRDMPLEIHPQAPPAHIAAECAGEQGKFWEYHDLLFDRQAAWSGLDPAGLDEALAAYAGELGLDESFGECTRSPEAKREMEMDYAHARSIGLTGTPSFLIGGEGHDFVAVSGAQPYSVFRSLFNERL